MKSQTMLPVAPPSGGPGMESVPQLIAATAHTLPEQRHALERARSFAEPLIGGECLDSGENTLAHADAVAPSSSPLAAPRPCRPPATWCTPVST
jgi:GTP pyrophosphokinase